MPSPTSCSCRINRLRPEADAETRTLRICLNGIRPFQNFAVAKRKLDELSNVTGWRLHDLRRTCVSGMARLGIAPHVADKILNHPSGTISGVAAVYQRHEFLPERQAGLELWGAHIDQLLGGMSHPHRMGLKIVA